MRKSSSGFTIVELLIVIVVIGVLAAITVVAYSGIQSRARDAERQHDIAAIQKVLELYYIDNSTYPTHTQLQDPTWRKANLATTDQGIFINPQDTSGSTNSMTASGSAVSINKYDYYAATTTGGLCTTNSCPGYRMAWKLEANPTLTQYKEVNR